MIDLRNKEMGRILKRELQANFAVAGADLPRHLSELLDRLRESDDTTQPQGPARWTTHHQKEHNDRDILGRHPRS